MGLECFIVAKLSLASWFSENHHVGFKLRCTRYVNSGYPMGHVHISDNTGEVQSFTFKCENTMSALNWLCLVMTLLNASFESVDFVQGENI
jgi:hypothetical protein